jgi:DNA polymerase-4
MRERSIIHINVADFAVAVERAVDCRLRRRPLIVAPEGAARAAVYDMSEEAYRSGVRKGMALSRARRCCRDAVILPPHPDRYERAMAALLRHARPYSPLIEMTDHQGHLFIDATGTGRLFGPPPDLAARIRHTIRTDMGFDPIWSVAPNKLVAKVATRTVKPNGESIVEPGKEADFLAPLPIRLIPGIDPADLHRLAGFNLTRTGQVRRLTLAQLAGVFDRHAQSLYDAVRGIDPSPVCPVGRQPPVIRVEHTFGNDTHEVPVVEATLYRLVEQAGAALRRQRLAARRVGILIDYSDGGRVIRQARLAPAGTDDFGLFAAARSALYRAWVRRVRIRNLRLVCDRLTFPPAQQALFSDAAAVRQRRHETLTAAVDAVRRRFGDNALRYGRTPGALPPAFSRLSPLGRLAR